jgi:hypothetical protein
MARTARYARCESPKRSWTLSTTAANGHSQRNKETGEPDDATSILSGSAGGWEKRPKGPRSQPTQLQCSNAGGSCVGFSRLIRLPRRHVRGKNFGILGSPTVSVLISQNGAARPLIFIDAILPIADTLFDSSPAQQLHNHSVYTKDFCQWGLYRSFLSPCSWRSTSR